MALFLFQGWGIATRLGSGSPRSEMYGDGSNRAFRPPDPAMMTNPVYFQKELLVIFK